MELSLSIPKDAEIFVKKGDRIDFGTKLFTLKKRKDIRVPIAETLSIRPDEIFRYMTKIIGEDVVKGEELAKKTSFFSKKKVSAPENGIVRQINHETGEITISIYEGEKTTDEVEKAQFRGVVLECSPTAFKINIAGGESVPVKNVTSDGFGKVFYFTNEAMYFSISEKELRERIVVIADLKPHIEVKCEALGCRGFVYIAGQLSPQTTAAQLTKVPSYDTIISLERQNVIFSKKDALAVFYD